MPPSAYIADLRLAEFLVMAMMPAQVTVSRARAQETGGPNRRSRRAKRRKSNEHAGSERERHGVVRHNRGTGTQRETQQRERPQNQSNALHRAVRAQVEHPLAKDRPVAPAILPRDVLLQTSHPGSEVLRPVIEVPAQIGTRVKSILQDTLSNSKKKPLQLGAKSLPYV